MTKPRAGLRQLSILSPELPELLGISSILVGRCVAWPRIAGEQRQTECNDCYACFHFLNSPLVPVQFSTWPALKNSGDSILIIPHSTPNEYAVPRIFPEPPGGGQARSKVEGRGSCQLSILSPELPCPRNFLPELPAAVPGIPAVPGTSRKISEVGACRKTEFIALCR
jgi:hypothetical protein